MYKLCKWIYELGYNFGKRAGREEVYAEQYEEKMIARITRESTPNPNQYLSKTEGEL